MEITNRVDPCRCGCGGQDPWHARSFDRVVHDIVDIHVEDTFGNTTKTLIKKGTAQFPWGRDAVYFLVTHPSHLLPDDYVRRGYWITTNHKHACGFPTE